MAKRILKKITVVILILPLLTLWIITRLLSEIFSEAESITGDWVDKAGRMWDRVLKIT